MTQLFAPFYNNLLASGQFSHEQIKQALILSKREGRSLLQAIEMVIGKVLSPELKRAYKKYHLFELKIVYGVNSLDPEIESISAQAIVELSRELVFSFEQYRRYKMLPFAKQTGNPATILVAMVNPDNLEAQDELHRILKFNHGLGLRRLVITQMVY